MHTPQKLTSEVLDTAGRIMRRGRAGLMLLLEADENAKDLHHDCWDFAVELESLQAAGLTNSDLRWLIYKGYIEHARELTLSGDQRRSFRPHRSPTFHKRTSFVLLEAGIPFAMTAYRQAGADASAAKMIAELIHNGIQNSAGSTRSRNSAGATPDAQTFAKLSNNGNAISVRTTPVPTWDRDRQELRLAGKLIKQFKVPAANQEMILAAFEEEQWPPRVDDPLPPHPSQDSKRRLHDTINSLNRSHKNALIRFLGDGSGQGVRWEPMTHENERVGTHNGSSNVD